jgi:hypothetical protein
MKQLLRSLLLATLLCAQSAQSSRAELSALQVKSAYVFNFIKFVEWPAHQLRAGDKVRLCVIGDDRLHSSLAGLSGRKVGAYQLQVRASTEAVALDNCHVLYIGELGQRRLLPIIKSLQDAPTLTISDIPGFAERGGGIGLLLHDDRMLFEVNLASTRKAGLRLSGQMLNLASNVFGK